MPGRLRLLCALFSSSSAAGVLCCLSGLLVASQSLWIRHFWLSLHSVEFAAGFCLVAVWIVPFMLSLSLAANDSVLPGGPGTLPPASGGGSCHSLPCISYTSRHACAACSDATKSGIRTCLKQTPALGHDSDIAPSQLPSAQCMTVTGKLTGCNWSGRPPAKAMRSVVMEAFGFLRKQRDAVMPQVHDRLSPVMPDKTHRP